MLTELRAMISYWVGAWLESSYRECDETMYNCTAVVLFLVIAYVLVSRGSLRFARLSVSVIIVFVVLEEELVEMDSCQSKVGTFDFLLTEVAFDYLLAGFFHISFENVWQFSKELDRCPLRSWRGSLSRIV